MRILIPKEPIPLEEAYQIHSILSQCHIEEDKLIRDWRLLKRTDPKKLTELIQEHVLSPRNPKKIKSTRKDSLFQMKLNNEDPKQIGKKVERPLKMKNPENPSKLDDLCYLMQDLLHEFKAQKESLKNLHQEEVTLRKEHSSPKEQRQNNAFSERYPRIIQNRLIKKIRQKEVDFELWDTFVDFIEGFK